ncbi:tRNA pseudouridine55 synthase [Brevibacterium iodinum ATCC 49514]|uniref:tRNA pseudouridine synthase B n=1 Tax=Brevibacterium iodinum ATCC 49514 TaxID=1255616 RepID=A0A2H1KGB1_9MICO|nr:tRNA pseudouridine(55) synthase TruB [Brevibacterium iodinum]SMX98746.1 tRNA pseudouridine55 synthase [Brevibacterium iodinum ATCC 49514]SUW12999.1 tRNA pseudouridine synthase B [Brevibacterium iodinum]
MSDTSPQGVLVCDKPQGLSSHGVVSRIRRWFGTKKVGHAGTLDPMATGVLVLGLGRGTKLLTYITGVSKTYFATIRLGSSTPTDDADSEPDRFADPSDLARVDAASIEAAVAKLRGPIDQVPSAVSAIKVDGKRSYARVRAGEDVELKARRVEVSEFQIIDIRFSSADGHIDVDVEVDCSSGTYVRALARDIGTDLGIFGHLTALRRTRVGDFHIDQAVTLPEDLDVPAPTLISLAEAARTFLPVVTVDADRARALMQGKTVAVGDWHAGPSAGDSGNREVAVVCDDALVSVAEVRRNGGLKSLTAFAIDLA